MKLQHLKYTIIHIVTMSLLLVFPACNKDALLNEKPTSNLAIPSSLDDFQAMFDVSMNMNVTPGLGDSYSDNYFVIDTYYQNAAPEVKSMYAYAVDAFSGFTNLPDWNTPYKQVFISNIVLEGLKTLPVTASNQQSWNNIQGQALFYRAYAFFNIAQLFAPIYDSTTATSELGIPLRLSSNIDTKSTRSTLKETYEQIFSDLLTARSLLSPIVPANNKNRPSQPAALALLARIFLSMRNYNKAGLYADSCLSMYSALVDFNTVKLGTGSAVNVAFNTTSTNNNEVMLNTNQNTAGPANLTLALVTQPGNVSVDSNLYNSYVTNDLRKVVFYYKAAGKNTANCNTGYGGAVEFSGLATNEIYLIRAECYARAGNTVAAMNDLNTLLSQRWRTATYVKYVAVSSVDALNQILAERRKELPFSGVRFSDLRRLNKEGANITINHIISGQTYTLKPNDPKYVFPIPDDIIALTGMPQNKRQ